jgi:CRISPR/Cas system-associated endoribonuclease Cas2
MTREVWLVSYDIIVDNKTTVAKTGSIYFDLNHNNLEDIKDAWSRLNKQLMDNFKLAPPCEVKITNAIKLGEEVLVYQQAPEPESPPQPEETFEPTNDIKE